MASMLMPWIMRELVAFDAQAQTSSVDLLSEFSVNWVGTWSGVKVFVQISCGKYGGGAKGPSQPSCIKI
jgi:hypothetical protein